MEEVIALVLAAGKGTRMKSKLPKVLHKAGGVPMVGQVLRAVKDAGTKREIVVVGFGAEAVTAYRRDGGDRCPEGAARHGPCRVASRIFIARRKRDLACYMRRHPVSTDRNIPGPLGLS